ncbi:MAG TPA: hypothetical protein VFV46_10330 [Lacibacter sp.]|nr:hypothetical protein [Lacibacter sp.]
MTKYFLIIFIISFKYSYSQDSIKIKYPKLLIEAGAGVSGSFSVIDYSDFTPISGSKEFARKNFIGSAQNLSVGILLKKNWEVRFGVHYEYYKRWINSIDTLRNSVVVNINRDIHHKNFMWYGGVTKKFNVNKGFITTGIGLYYLVSKVQTISVYPGFVSDHEQIWKGKYNGDGGAYIETGYEYRFQPKVHLGIKSQFYYTISLGYQESLSLYPYIKIIL